VPPNPQSPPELAAPINPIIATSQPPAWLTGWLLLCGKIFIFFIIKTPSFPPPVKFLYGFRVSAPLCPE
jgi:hypothetical protein